MQIYTKTKDIILCASQSRKTHGRNVNKKNDI